jgi:hypothetical protein
VAWTLANPAVQLAIVGARRPLLIDEAVAAGELHLGDDDLAHIAPDGLVDVRIGVAVAVFLGLAAVDHLVTATVARRTYASMT